MNRVSELLNIGPVKHRVFTRQAQKWLVLSKAGAAQTETPHIDIAIQIHGIAMPS